MIGLHTRGRTLLHFDGRELTPRKRERVAAHLRDCPRCRERLTWMREVRRVAGAVTVPPGLEVLGRIQERVAAGDSVLLPSVGESRGAGPDGHRRRSTMVAGFVLLLTAGGLAAAQSEVVRERASALIASLFGAPAAPAPEAGVDVAVPFSGLTIVLEGVDPSVRLRVSFGEASLLAVVGRGVAAQARFTTAPSRVTVTNVAGGILFIEAPRTAGPITVLLEGTRILNLEGERVRLSDGSLYAQIETSLGELRR